jgi:hypothetical protein
MSHDNEHIVMGSRDRMLTVVRLETGEIEYSIEQHTDAVTGVALTQDDAILITGMYSHEMSLLSIEFYVRYVTDKHHAIKLSNDGAIMACSY